MSTTSDGPAATPAGNNQNNDRSAGRNKNRNKNRSNASRAPRTTKFEGKIEALKDYVYDISGTDGGSDDFYRTTREIGAYMARTHKEAGEFRQAFNPSNLGSFGPLLEEPPEPHGMATNTGAQLRWTLAMKRHEARVATRKDMELQAYAVVLVLGQCSRAVLDGLAGGGFWNLERH